MQYNFLGMFLDCPKHKYSMLKSLKYVIGMSLNLICTQIFEVS